jgi:hypothetical protein
LAVGTAVGLAVGAWWLAPLAPGQPTPAGVVRGHFRAPEYDPDNPNQVRSLLTGVGATYQANGLILLNTLRWEGYTKDCQTNLIILGTNCVFDPRTKLAYSPDRLRVESGDGRFVVEGVGFLWQPTNSHLIISNQVHTRIRGLQPAAAATRS